MTADTMSTVSPRKAEMDFDEYLMAELRCAALRARILQADIEAVGIALKHHMISPDQAISLLHDVDAVRLVGTPPAPKEVPR